MRQLDGADNGRTNNNNMFEKQQRGSSITVRRHDPKLPQSAAERALPLQEVNRVLIYDIPKIVSRASERARARLEVCTGLLYAPYGVQHASTTTELVEVPMSRSCTTADCEIRVANGIIRRVSAAEALTRPTKGVMRSFTVVELNKGPQGKGRRRAIDHPAEQNDACYAAGYKSEVDLQHCSAYLDGVFQECGCVSDIHASFYGLELPAEARAYYRFRDEAGNLYEATRSMMGHTVTAEIQHLITSIVAGHPGYVKPEFAAPCIVKVWIDNVRYTGTRALVAKAREKLIVSAAACNVAFDVAEVSTSYEFIGILFNHINHTVCLGSKTRGKLPASIPNTMRAGDLEGLVGRLIFAAAVRQQPLVNNWWALKWTRRFFNKLNRGALSVDDVVRLDGIHRGSLEHWLATACVPHVVNRALHGNTATLFTDATLTGWGAVVIFDNDRMLVSGGRFLGDQSVGDICRKEAWAVDNALESFADALRGISRINLFVDNTSVVAAMRRGMPRADSLVDPIKSAWEKIIGSKTTLFADYVSTHINPADAISRGENTVNVDATKHAMRTLAENNNQGHKNQRKGAGNGTRFVADTS